VSGVHAPGPVDAPAPRWRTVLGGVWTQLTENHVTMLAAGVAFYAFLSLFPGLVALVALYGLVADPIAVEATIASVGGVLPEAAQSVINDQLKSLSSHSGTTLSLTLVVSLLFAWWSAASAMKALMESLNVAYGVAEQRSVVRFNVEAWLSWGALVATVLWLVGSALLSLYVSTFDTFNKTYGSLAAVVVLMLWLELSALLVILGGQLNAELERTLNGRGGTGR
jgi:membrane protein